MSDPIEKIVADGLTRAGIIFLLDDVAALDFYLPAYDVYIEVKQFHTKRIAEQMSRADNVIAIQGRRAAEWFSGVLTSAESPSS
jgi:hypothetical protein